MVIKCSLFGRIWSFYSHYADKSSFISNKQTKTPSQTAKDRLNIKRRVGFCGARSTLSLIFGKKNLWLHNIFHLTVEEEIVFSLWQWGKLKGWVKQLAIRGTIVETHSYSSVIIQLLKEYILHEVAYSSSKSLTISCKQLIILCVHLQVLQL